MCRYIYIIELTRSVNRVRGLNYCKVVSLRLNSIDYITYPSKDFIDGSHTIN